MYKAYLLVSGGSHDREDGSEHSKMANHERQGGTTSSVLVSSGSPSIEEHSETAKRNYECDDGDGSQCHESNSCDDECDEDAESKRVRPLFIRTRVVNMTSDIHMSCSCGFPSRMRMPCVHIFAVTGETHPKMFHVRWWIDFQLYYGRNHPLKDSAFNNILLAPYQGVCVAGLIPPCSNSFPQLYDGTSPDDWDTMQQLHDCYKRGCAVVYNEPIPIPACDNISQQDMDRPEESDGFEVSTSHTPEAQRLLAPATIADAGSAVTCLDMSAIRAESFKVLAEAWKVIENSPNKGIQLLQAVKILHTGSLSESKDDMERKRNGPSMNSGVGGDNFTFGESAVDTQRKSKRGKYGFERSR